MNHSGDAAEQIVRMSLEGVEVAARITGSAAKEIALLLIAALKSEKSTLKPRGKARLISMLKSGKPLEIFSVKESDLQKFTQGAKEYGIVYCVLRNTKNSPDGLCDIMVKADDAPKISRLVERFKFATVDKARLESELVAEKAEKAADAQKEASKGTEPEAPDVGDTEKLLDDLLGTTEGKAEPDAPEQADKSEPVHPEPVKTGKEQTDTAPFLASDQQMPPPFAPTSDSKKTPERAILNRPSTREELREITAARKAKEAELSKTDERVAENKAKNPPKTTTHQQPQQNKSKSKKSKGNR